MTAAPDRLAAALSDHYTLERELGEGGMATVYLAEDIKHDRKVALKVLKPELAAVIGAERFVVEIKTTAALQHPHILPLFDSGEADGFLYYVMPFIDGETLRDKLNRERQFAVDEAIKITTEVAEALHYAHGQGVVHRDIKPENILLTDGRPMVADFGIALALSAAAGGRMTETGLSLGTPHYMSPEQATAEKDISARSDVYSLASVFYEMLTGDPPHTGSSAQQVIMKIISEEAESVTAYRKAVPPNVAAAVGKALEKLPADRFESAEAFKNALGNPSFTTATASAMALHPTTARGWLRSPLSWGAVGVALVALTALGYMATKPEPIQPVRVFEVEMGGMRSTALSADGTRLAFERDGSLFVRDLDQLTPRPLGIEGSSPQFSPDGEQIAFRGSFGSEDRGRVFVTSTRGGGVTPVIDSVEWLSTWNVDGGLHAIISHAGSRLLVRQAEVGSDLDTVAVLEPGFVYNGLSVLPGGAWVVGARAPASERGGWTPTERELIALDLRDGKVRALGVMGSFPHLIGNEFLLFNQYAGVGTARRTLNLMVARFDHQSAELTSTPIVLMADHYLSAMADNAGMLLLRRPAQLGRGDSRYSAVFLGRDGSMTPIPGLDSTMDWAEPIISPSGDQLLLAGGDPATFEDANDIWVHDLADGLAQKRTFGGVEVIRMPLGWSPDGETVFFVQATPDSHVVMSAPRDFSSQPTVAFTDSTVSRFGNPILGTDGRTLLWWVRDTLKMGTLGQSGSEVVLALPGGSRGSTPAQHPGGDWVAYSTFQSGQNEVFVQSLSGGQGRIQVSIDGGRQPMWNASGGTLVYTVGDLFNFNSDSSIASVWEAELDLVNLRVTSRNKLFDLDEGLSILTSQGVASESGFFATVVRDVTTPSESAAGWVVMENALEAILRLLGERQ